MKKKILIYGVGPFGSLFAERLAEAGHDISVLDQGGRQLDLKKHGVVIENASTGKISVTRLPVVDRLSEDEYYDLAIVPMRKNKVSEILPSLAANKKVPTYLFMMNNAEGPDRLDEALGKERVLSGFPLPGGYQQGHVTHMLPVEESKPYTLPIGENDGRTSRRTLEVAEVLGSMRGYKVEIRDDMDDWLKSHVALLVPSFVPAIYACGMDLDRFAATRDARVLSIRALREAFTAIERIGVSISPPGLRRLNFIPEPLFVFLLGKLAKTAALQNALEDLKTKPDEIKHLANEFFELIRPANTETPAIDFLSGYIYTDKKPLPSGKKDIPLNWKGVYEIAGGALVLYGLYRIARK
jgi:2-dehydropantoate 2-reductase